jgi:transposase InsO family protein
MKQFNTDKINIISLANQGLCSTVQAASSLNISQRQAQRLVKSLKENNNDPLILSPKPRSYWNKKSDKLCDLVVSLKKESPYRSNYAIADLIKENEKGTISAPTVRKILIKNNCYQKENIKRRTFKKFEAKEFGQILQMDTTEGCWLKGYRRTKLIMVIDDYSRAILGFKWTDKDDTWNNMLVLKGIIAKYGLPGMVYTDNDSKFRTIRHGSIYFKYHQEEYQTEIHKALNRLGIALVNHPPYHAFCKGKIERLFRFIQERFIPEMKANDFEGLNQEFSQWVDWYNNNHINRMTNCKPKERFKPNGFKPLSGNEDLDYAFSLKEMRKIDKYNSFTLDGSRYFIRNQDCLVGDTVELAINPTHKIRVYHNKEFIQQFKKKTK